MLIRILSINIWDLPVPLPGSARRRRLEHLLGQLAQSDADLVLIQEAFRPSFKPRIAEVLVRHQCDEFIDCRERRFGIPMDGSGGLVTFSRFPLARSRYVPFRCWPGMKPDERIGRKGCLWTEVEVGGKRVLIGNVHLYAGIKPAHGRARAMQTRHLLNQLEKMSSLPTILAGDFNMAREFESTENGPNGFELLTGAGFAEVAAGSSAGLATMSPKTNRFARYWLTANLERRLTQVFFRGDGLRSAAPPRVALDQPPVSDHFGLLATLEIV